MHLSGIWQFDQSLNITFRKGGYELGYSGAGGGGISPSEGESAKVGGGSKMWGHYAEPPFKLEMRTLHCESNAQTYYLT